MRRSRRKSSASATCRRRHHRVVLSLGPVRVRKYRRFYARGASPRDWALHSRLSVSNHRRGHAGEFPRIEVEALRGSAEVVYVRPARLFSELSRTDCLAVLSETERERAGRFVLPQAADLFVAAHVLARCVIAQQLGCSPHELTFRLTERGRPELAGDAASSGLRFNLAHTDGLVVCGLAFRAAIGVDVERVNRRVDRLRLAARVCSKPELAGLQALAGAAQRRRFAELWTLKEAYVKATGLGLPGSLRQVSFAADRVDPVPVHFESCSADHPSQWCMRRLTLASEHCVAIALRAGSSARVSWHEWKPCIAGITVAPAELRRRFGSDARWRKSRPAATRRTG